MTTETTVQKSFTKEQLKALKHAKDVYVHGDFGVRRNKWDRVAGPATITAELSKHDPHWGIMIDQKVKVTIDSHVVQYGLTKQDGTRVEDTGNRDYRRGFMSLDRVLFQTALACIKDTDEVYFEWNVGGHGNQYTGEAGLFVTHLYLVAKRGKKDPLYFLVGTSVCADNTAMPLQVRAHW